MANTQTIVSKIGILYSDFPNNFAQAPFSNDLAKVTNVSAVKQSIKNIARTALGERLYDNTIGSSANYSLFGLNDSMTESIIETNLQDALAKETRASIIRVAVDAHTNPDAIVVQIYFAVINDNNNYSTQIIIARVR